MAALRYPCIVSYIGACLDPPCLVMEYCARGSVYGVLSGASMDEQAARALIWPRLLRFAWDAAKGMHTFTHCARPLFTGMQTAAAGGEGGERWGHRMRTRLHATRGKRGWWVPVQPSVGS